MSSVDHTIRKIPSYKSIVTSDTSPTADNPRSGISSDATIPIKLVLKHGFIHKHAQGAPDMVQMFHDSKDAKTTRRAPYLLPAHITHTEFLKVLVAQVLTLYNIDLKAYNTENGGKGSVWRVECSIDVAGGGKATAWTSINVPNEESWDAALGLMRIAKGETEISLLFAVDRNRTLSALITMASIGCVLQ